MKNGRVAVICLHPSEISHMRREPENHRNGAGFFPIEASFIFFWASRPLM